MLEEFRRLGVKTASADEIGQRVFASDEVQNGLRDLLEIQDSVDRALLRQEMAANPGLRRKVNRLMHPKIFDEMMSCEAELIEVPLLIETVLHPFFREVWMVTCGAEEQLKRLTIRLGNVSEAESWIQSQLPTSVKIAFADEVLRTNQPLVFVFDHVRRLRTEKFGLQKGG